MPAMNMPEISPATRGLLLNLFGRKLVANKLNAVQREVPPADIVKLRQGVGIDPFERW
jgi:hypothetical protein